MRLYTATRNQIEWAEESAIRQDIIPASLAPDIFLNILNQFEVENNADYDNPNEYEILRDDLCAFRHDIVNNRLDELDEEFLNKGIKSMGMSKEDFLSMISSMIDDSDQENEYIRIMWY